MRRHEKSKHEVKMCYNSEFSTPSLYKKKAHKKTQHAPDDFYEE